MPTQGEIFEIDYALMSGVADNTRVFDVNKFPAPYGYQLGYPMPPNSSGLNAITFIKGNEIVIAFSCTDAGDYRDIITDIELGMGQPALQLYQAAEYYLYIKENNPGCTITFTGHSLGGGLAALMGVFFDEMAVTFDQAPFSAGQTVEKRSYASFPLSFGVAAYAKSTPHFS